MRDIPSRRELLTRSEAEAVGELQQTPHAAERDDPGLPGDAAEDERILRPGGEGSGVHPGGGVRAVLRGVGEGGAGESDPGARYWYLGSQLACRA